MSDFLLSWVLFFVTFYFFEWIHFFEYFLSTFWVLFKDFWSLRTYLKFCDSTLKFPYTQIFLSYGLKKWDYCRWWAYSFGTGEVGWMYPAWNTCRAEEVGWLADKGNLSDPKVNTVHTHPVPIFIKWFSAVLPIHNTVYTLTSSLSSAVQLYEQTGCV